MASRPLGPLYEGRPGDDIVPSEFKHGAGCLKPVKIEMPERQPIEVIGLDKRVGRAGYILMRAQPRLDQAPRQGCLSGTELAVQSHHVPCP